MCVSRFKLHLRPLSKPDADVSLPLPHLPAGKRIIDIFADFMSYLYKSVRTYIQETHTTGVHLWESLETEIQFILTHPNGWGGAQQAQMRSAAIRAGLIPDTKGGRARVEFVSEGEASLHFCIQKGLATAGSQVGNHRVRSRPRGTDASQRGEGILVVDAGGRTVDLSAYTRDPGLADTSFKECAPAQCSGGLSSYACNLTF